MNMDELPSSWAVTKLREIVNILDSRRIPINSEERQARIKGKDVSELFPYFGATGQVAHIDDFLFNEPLILLGEDGVPFLDSQKSKAYRVSGKTWVNNHAHVLSVIDDLTNDIFISSYLNHFDYERFVTGTTRLKLTQAAMNEIPVPLPPLLEQKRIADKLERLLVRVDAARERLERVPGILKRFRASVLEQAVGGELTREWREHKSLPDWTNEILSELCLSVTDGDHQAPPQSLKGIPFITVSAISSGKLLLENATRCVTNEYFESLRDTRKPNRGDILYSVTGTIGVPAIIDTDKKFTFQRHIAILKVNIEKVNRKYLLYSLASEYVRVQALEVATGTAQLTIPLNGLRNLLIPVPPLLEQIEIVRRVEQLFTLADQLEGRYLTAKAQLERLTPALLAKAFRGELVEQDPTDEPASVLLERIRAERVAVAGKKALERKGRAVKEEAGVGETGKRRGRPAKAREDGVDVGSIPRASSVEDAVRLLEARREEREAVGTVQGGLFE